MSRYFIWVPVAAAVVASVLFFAQGGFGAGHGEFDQAIGILGVPGILVPAPDPIAANDFLLVIAWPAMWNVPLWAAMAALLRKRRLIRTAR